MKALLLATGALLSTAVATFAGDPNDAVPYYNGFGEHGNFTPSHPTLGCSGCGGGGGWVPTCSNQSTCPKDYLWADYCETKDCRPFYKQLFEKFSRSCDQSCGCGGGCGSNAGCASCGGGGCQSCAPSPMSRPSGCGCQPQIANQLSNPYGGWDGGKLRPVSQGSVPRLAPSPSPQWSGVPTPAPRRSRFSTMKPVVPEESSPSDNKSPPDSQLPKLSAPIAPAE